MSKELELRALAKLTLSLRVSGVRQDGFHLLEAEMVTVDLADSLWLSPGQGLEVVDLVGDGRTLSQVPTDEHNLVLRALALVGRDAHVRLVKRIPVGGGLGGGSADAAAVLRWAGWAPAIRAQEAAAEEAPELSSQLSMAAALGADVPFCLAGWGRAHVSGIGEQLSPLPFGEVEGRAYTLLTPPFGVSTAAVYRAWDEIGGPKGEGPNDLEPAALRVEPRLAEWRDRLEDATGKRPVLAGSGSTWFVEGEYLAEGLTVVHVAR
ncbi:MAG: 4-(cytidine 5'-diphospho)-2-C-methyl-D-erythritol kinase [Acidimicrobiales bacterium]